MPLTNVLFTVVVLCVSPSLSAAYDIAPLGCVQHADVSCCLTFHDVKKTWSEADNICLAGGSGLAILNTPDKDGKVREHMLKGAGRMDWEGAGFKAWCAGHASEDRQWKWSDGRLLNDSTSAAIKFGAEPKVYQECGAVEFARVGNTSSLRFSALNAYHCRLALNFICQAPVLKRADDNTTSCNIGPLDGSLSHGLCYAVVGSSDPDSFQFSWNKADNVCKSLGASLASFNDDWDFSDQFLTNMKHGNFWVGLTRKVWIWLEHVQTGGNQSSDSTRELPLNTTSLRNPDPVQLESSDCLAASLYPGDRYGWSDETCHVERPFICETRTLITTTAQIVTTQSSNNGTTDEDEKQDIMKDWANVIIPCAMIGIVLILAIVSVSCYLRQKRKGYTPQQ